MRSDENDNPTVPTVNEPLSQSGIDISNPLYMHPSDNPGAALVPTPFDGFGYRSWRRSVMCDDMVTSWILNSLTKEIADSVEYKEINDLSQGSLDITSYYTKMKKLWEELNTLITKSHCTCNCSCGAKESMHKAEQDRRLIQFLMGLNETYIVVRESILMMNPLPSIAQSFSLLIQEERQREIKPTGHLDFGHNQNPNTGQNSFSQNTRQGSNNNSANRFNRGNRTLANAHVVATESQPAENDSQNRYVCHDNPQNVSLTKEEYNQLVTLLQQFQSSGIGDHGGGTNATSGTTNFAGMVACTSSIDFGKLSCECFKNKADSWIIDSKASNNMTFNRSLLTNIINLPYPLLVILPNGYKVKVTEIGSVILNSKITLDKVMYVPTFRYNLISIHSLASHLSCIVAFFNLCCVLQAPSMKRPLVIGKVNDGLYILCPSCLKKNNASLAEKDNSRLPIISSCCTCDTHCPTHSTINVPVHTNKCVSLPSLIVNNSCASASKHVHFEDVSSELPGFFSQSWSENNVNVLWHNRLGHVPFVKMKRITSIPANFSPKQPFTCTICPMARQERLPFPQKTSVSNKIFELLHVDLWGPYHIPTHDKHKYFITKVDDYSRSTWTHLLSSKCNVIDILKNFMSLVENQFGIKIKSIRSDNGLEFTSGEATKLFQSKGIIHQRTCPYTPQQNGVVERKHKYLLETARALLFQSKLPLRYWGECVLCATYIINRLPSNSINNKTPYELLYKRKPKYSHLKSFGCLCYPTIPIPHRDKFNPRTAPHVFVGYPFNTKGYKVLNLATRKIYISRDVVFNESIFPFNCSINKSSNSLVFYPVPFIDSLDEHLPTNTGNMQTTENLSDQGNVDNTPISMSPIHAASPLSHGISSLLPQNTSSEHNIEQTDTEQIHPTRQSHRTRKLPTYLQDYVHSLPKFKNNSTSLNALFSVNQHIASDLLTPDSQALVRNICHDREPSSYKEAAIDPAW
ncbi:uncharacterized protein LOC142178474 [Nicotiana tabacum]|uniref:Uncharacterized protein LOC142178474 n=1 Tax=Nicotiana tabacum TaxID=4097 RepID=A0AC58U3U9_TOBAC